jgi:hypothetical protein
MPLPHDLLLQSVQTRPSARPDVSTHRALDDHRPTTRVGHVIYVTEDPTMRKPAALALAATTAATASLALQACGTTSDADHVRATVNGWMTDIRDGRSTDACRLLTPTGRKAFVDRNILLASSTCESLVQRASATLTAAQRDALDDIAVHRIVFADNHTKAIIYDDDVTLPNAIDADGNARPTILRKDADGAWKIEDLG